MYHAWVSLPSPPLPSHHSSSPSALSPCSKDCTGLPLRTPPFKRPSSTSRVIAPSYPPPPPYSSSVEHQYRRLRLEQQQFIFQYRQSVGLSSQSSSPDRSLTSSPSTGTDDWDRSIPPSKISPCKVEDGIKEERLRPCLFTRGQMCRIKSEGETEEEEEEGWKRLAPSIGGDGRKRQRVLEQDG